MTAHSETAQEVLQTLQSAPETGLSESQIQERRAQHGENRLKEKKKKTNLQRFAEQFKDAMILILIALLAALRIKEKKHHK